MMRVYYDNVIASGLVTGRIWPDTEKAALLEVETAHDKGTIKRVTSRESWREQERTQDNVGRAQLQSARELVSVVQTDHRLLGFSNIYGPYGTVAANPIVTDLIDEPLFKNLMSLGLKESDARHFMYTAANSCDRFVTLDSDFLHRRQSLEARCPSLVVVTPSELAVDNALGGANSERRCSPAKRRPLCQFGSLEVATTPSNLRLQPMSSGEILSRRG